MQGIDIMRLSILELNPRQKFTARHEEVPHVFSPAHPVSLAPGHRTGNYPT